MHEIVFDNRMHEIVFILSIFNIRVINPVIFVP
jgi:hypothetical protein